MDNKAIYTIPWDIGRNYRFEGEIILSTKFKKVCLGRFLKTAPDGLAPDVPYCLKIIDVNVKDTELPQCREYFDLVDFKGDHLRPVLARNPAAQVCAAQLRQRSTCRNAADCVIVEPLLKPCDELFQNCSKKPISLRLDAIEQFALGCEELTNPENVLGPYFIEAHRDLKAGNIMMAYLDSKPRYYLIDFASVRLNKDDPISAIHFSDDIPSKTFRGPMSPHNTAPEDLEGSRFKVSGKTDIYALGMLLAELFLTIPNHAHNNPNAHWAAVHGWVRNEAAPTHLNLKRAFDDALELYEPIATWDNTWIEQDLAANGCKLLWENMPDQRVLTAIRKLFFDSTRIDPEKRINLPEFLERIHQIIELEKHSTSRIPLSIYLFDQTDFSKNRQSYQNAARAALTSEKKVKGESASALCVAFRRSLPGDRTMLDALQFLGNTPLSNVNQLDTTLQYCDTRNGMGQNTALYALNFAVQQLNILTASPDTPYIFTGNIHLFSPDIPALDSIAPIYKKNGQPVDLMSYANIMSTNFGGVALRVYLYSSAAPNIYQKEKKWYTTHILLSPPEEPSYVEFHANEGGSPFVTPPQAPPPSRGPSSNSNYYVGKFDYYIETPDGQKLYIGMK